MFIKKNIEEVKKEKVDIAEKTYIRWMLGPDDNVPNFYFRIFDVEPGGSSPYHKHDWEHEVFILEGSGYLKTGDGNIEFKKNDILFVPPNEMHQFVNSGNSLLRFICVIPKRDY